MNLIGAVDFTASNGNPMSPNSLHNINPSKLLNPEDNQYLAALMSVGGILLNFDTD